MVLGLVAALAGLAYAAVTLYRRTVRRGPQATRDRVDTVLQVIAVFAALTRGLSDLLDALTRPRPTPAITGVPPTTRRGGGVARYVDDRPDPDDDEE